MRIKNSIKNTIIAFISNFLTIIVGLISQAVFIKTLGEEYLGINGLFSNIISMLGIVELGIGSAIIYNLYKPIAENNILKINSLMYFYKKCYNVIAVIVLLIGLSLIPFLDLFIKDLTIDTNINLIYILFITDVFASYILSYKRSIINANQKNYIVNLIHIGYLIILNLLQIIILVLTKNYYIYLIIKIVMRLLENIILTLTANKLYPYLNEKKENLDLDTKNDVFKKVKALFFHKIGTFVVLGTDNLIISKFLGIVQVGLYSNYSLIFDAVQKLFGQIIGVLTPSVGNLLVEKNKEKSFEVFKRIRFLNFWIATFTGSSILILMDSFITIWIGEKYILPFLVLSVLVFDYYQKSMRASYAVFKEAAGIYYEDRFVPLIESTLNIVASIILLHYFSLAGVFLGTIVSSLALWCYSYPKFVYKGLFDKSYLSYTKETFGYIFAFIMIASLTFFLSHGITYNNIYLKFTSNVLLAIMVPNVILLMIFHKSENFKYYVNLIKKLFKRG